MKSHPYHHTADADGTESLTVLPAGAAPVVVNGDHPNFGKILSAAKAGADPAEIADLADLSAAIGTRLTPLSERVSVADGRVYFDGDEIDNSLSRHLLRCLDADLTDYRPIVRFMDNVADNPEPHSRAQLWDWLKDRDFSITPDGGFVGFKGVEADGAGGFQSVAQGPAIVNGRPVNGHVPNNPGSTVEIARSAVAFDPAVGCAAGLHVGTHEYATGWARGGLLRVEVNPRDVVSVPTDCNAEKLRTCRYKVLEAVSVDAAPTYDPVDGVDW